MNHFSPTVFFNDYLGISFNVPQSHSSPIPPRSTLPLVCPSPPPLSTICVAYLLTGAWTNVQWPSP